MRNLCKLSVSCWNEIKQWEKVYKEYLSFSRVDFSTPQNGHNDIFSGELSIDIMSNGVMKVMVESLPQKLHLIHHDFYSKNCNKFFVINSCGALLLGNKYNREIISGGDSIIVPAWNDFFEYFPIKRSSLSLIIDVNTVCDFGHQLSNIAWKKFSTFKYGFELNKILCNYYLPAEDEFYEKNTNAFIELLGLELLVDKTFCYKIQEKDDRHGIIVCLIKQNVQNPNFGISSVAEILGVTERMIQYSLSKVNLKFTAILAKERCAFLANRIKHNPSCKLNVEIFDSGFKSMQAAIRQFKKLYGMSPKEYQKSIIKNIR